MMFAVLHLGAFASLIPELPCPLLQTMPQPSARQLVLPSLCADALALGSHWIYNPARIVRLYPDGARNYDDPRTDYHPGKSAGDFTHYGDQTMALLKSVVLRGGFDAAGWRDDWQRFWKSDPASYRDGATKATLDFLKRGSAAASESNDLAGAARIAPVLAALSDSPLEIRIGAARAQTALTHGDRATIDAAEFFTRAADALASGHSMDQALNAAASVGYDALDARAFLDRVIDAEGRDENAAGKQFGLTCHTPEAFPLTLWFLHRFQDQPLESIVRNTMAGGDNAARGLFIGLIMGAAHGTAWMPLSWIEGLRANDEIDALLSLLEPCSKSKVVVARIKHPDGHTLDGILQLPVGPPRAFALFAHCFTCGKSLRGATRVSQELARHGIATLRFDFTGIGGSEGDFAGTSFRSNVADLQVAADWLRENHRAPVLLIGHSLGGAAVLAAAAAIPESRGVATIGAPADPAHVLHLLGDDVETIREHGEAVVTLAGRKFTIGSRFLDDMENLSHEETIAHLDRDLLILHSPTDEIVGIENAGKIYSAARHPKSFHSLAGADHLLTGFAQADYAAGIIAAWASRFV